MRINFRWKIKELLTDDANLSDAEFSNSWGATEFKEKEPVCVKIESLALNLKKVKKLDGDKLSVVKDFGYLFQKFLAESYF